MQTTTVDVFAQDGYDVRTTMVGRVDNQGEPCEVCQQEPHYVDATVYGVANEGRMTGLCVSLDCCVYCIPKVIREMDPTEAVTVELGDSIGEDRGLMADQDGDRTNNYLDCEWCSEKTCDGCGPGVDNGLMADQDDNRPHPDAV